MILKIKRVFLAVLVLAFLGTWNSGVCLPQEAGQAKDRSYQRVVVLSDPHYGLDMSSGSASQAEVMQATRKRQTVEDINGWKDVDLVAVLGDIVARYGSPEEYAQAKAFVDEIRKHRAVVAGNHEYKYADQPGEDGKLRGAPPELQREKLERFKRTFGVPQLHFTKKLGNYLLVFLSTDAVGGTFTTEISERTLSWLEDTLRRHRKTPTLIFFHAPLKGTLENYSPKINGDMRIAQPERKLDDLLRANPQVLLWVSGHTHTPATNVSFNSPVNVYQGHVTNIHNSDLKRKTIWTNSLFLYPGRIVVKTWDHATGGWLEGSERVIPVPGG
ncbi:MAG: metallophosphoesterase [Desulfovibrio sp.]|nr:metallophosphoesterase [Desulfovibrio sp.]MBI4959459.1 metallophosphoesterase [Desulfovibrio sp.]